MIRLEGFDKRYGQIHAVKNLDLEVAAGESLVLLGSNGSGKSTILKAIAGLHAPSSGRILIDGIDILARPLEGRKRVAFLPQRMVLPGLLTGREVLAFYAGLKQVDPGRVAAALELVGLTGDADRFTREYSGGMLQRLGLGITYLEEVPLLLLDEPTLNLDPTGMERFREWIHELRGRGVTVVFASHLVLEALRLADRVAILSGGALVKTLQVSGFRDSVVASTTMRVVVDRLSGAMIEKAREAGAREEVCNDKSYAFKAPPEKRQKVIRAIEQAGGLIEELHTEPPNWESLVEAISRPGESP